MVIYKRSDGITAVAWCREHNIPQQTMRVYLDKGYLVDDACELAKKAHEKKLNQKLIMYKGKTAHSYFDSSTYTYIKNKVKLGCTIKEALALREYNKNHHPWISVHFMKKNKNWRDLLRKAGNL